MHTIGYTVNIQLRASDGDGDGSGGCGGSGGSSLRQHARREAVSMCTTRQGGCVRRVCRKESAHRGRRDDVVEGVPAKATRRPAPWGIEPY